MLAYILKRLLLMLPTLLGVLLVTFVVIQFVPGGPVEQYLAEAKAGAGGASAEGGGLSYRGAQGIDPYDPHACPWKRVAAFMGDVNLFIYPGYRFRAIDALITNFHLPRSSLLMLVSAFIAQAHPDDPDRGRRILLQSYEVAKQEGYRFFSFGDAMLIL